MPSSEKSPFPSTDADRRDLWEMLVLRDTRAFLAGDWNAVAGDFISEGFHGLDARQRQRPDEWRLTFPTLEHYRQEWLRQAADTAATADMTRAEAALLDATTLEQIEIEGDHAVAYKKFDGWLPARDGRRLRLNWQTLYVCRKQQGRWRISSFVGYLPYRPAEDEAAHFVAAHRQHRTAGPYTPVVGVSANARLFVISGQAPLDADGNVVGGTIEEQARVTLQNCRTQLLAAGCDFQHVFKATVYLTDLSHWSAFNAIYREFMSEPFPARTAVQTGLLPGFLVEVEMWAAHA